MKRYVISMTESELKLFSDFLSQKEFEKKSDWQPQPKHFERKPIEIPVERNKPIEIPVERNKPIEIPILGREEEFRGFVDHYGNALNFVENNYEQLLQQDFLL